MTAVGDGRYTATIGCEWVLAMVPQGGVLAAIAARAMATELHLDEGVPQALRTFHGVFVSPVPAGATGFTALAVFGAARPGFTFTELAFPVVPPAEDQPSFRDALPPEAGGNERVEFPFWGTTTVRDKAESPHVLTGSGTRP